jgi:hypothetical protein
MTWEILQHNNEPLDKLWLIFAEKKKSLPSSSCLLCLLLRQFAGEKQIRQNAAWRNFFSLNAAKGK